MDTKKSKGPVKDSTTPKDTDLQDNEINDNQPEEINEDAPPGGPHKTGELKLDNHGDSSEQPATQQEEQRQTLDLPTRRLDIFPRITYKQTNPRDSSQQEEQQAVSLPASKIETSIGTTIPGESRQLPSQPRPQLLMTTQPTGGVGTGNQPTSIDGEIETSQPELLETGQSEHWWESTPKRDI